MIVNGTEIDFDLDNRKDYDRFIKALNIWSKKNEKGGTNINDMENLLVGCIKAEQIKELLKDGRISTLSKVFIEFFGNAVDQLGVITRTCREAANSLQEIKGKADLMIVEHNEIKQHVESISSVGGGEQFVSVVR